MPTRPLTDLRFLQLLAPAFLAAAGAMAIMPMLASQPTPPEDLQRTGVIKTWRLETDGTLYVELAFDSGAAADPEERDPLQAPTVWFRTPPTRDQNPTFAELALDIVLAATPAGGELVPITATAKLERALTGATPEEALPLLALSSP
jgi:hypothetical protein